MTAVRETETLPAPELLTVKDLMALTQLGRNTIYELINNGELGHIRVGTSLRVPRAEFERWVTKSVQRPVASPIPFSLAPKRR